MKGQINTVFFDEIWSTIRSVDFYLPSKITKSKAVFLIHGGGHSGGDKTGMYHLMWQFQKLGLPVASVNYRLAPQENKWKTLV